jgi:hypothetical protein
LPVSADKFPFQKHAKDPHDYYQTDIKITDEIGKKSENIDSESYFLKEPKITSLIKKNMQKHSHLQPCLNNNVLSMELSESEGISHSNSNKNDEGNLYKMDSKTNLKKVLGIDYFENQSTLKQNMEFLKENVDYDDEIVKPVSDNLNILGQRAVESRRQKHRRIEYRERLEEENKSYKKSKSQKGNKHQYIRNNHNIISKHQKNKSSDSNENSILKKTNGFEILYEKGEKFSKLLHHDDSYLVSNGTSYSQDDVYSVNVVEEDESSSISNIGNFVTLINCIENSRAIEISYRIDDDMI